MRLGMILIGGSILLLLCVLSLIAVLLHLAVPLLPVAGIAMMITGWVPEIQVILVW